ncbi:hypothetical protein [Thermoactinomyces sp. DSM 45892]|uniref:hypothetical protein n=1 Tax=Thermoactinomyces sp. DSM 45892 TaxID=1882753 RepID=UPI0008966FAD|nr:hypothetical protein [Thermoactinomyces sp. DSM 45892]SDZ00939.1 hypothetical protein SAMN05444416_111110 [Thermoactinomyces sp. DSM 45892]
MSYRFKPNRVGLSRFRNALFSGVIAGTEKMLSLSNENVPLDEGTLLRSGVASFSESKLSGCVSYNTPYARRLHEHPEYRFQQGRKGKWLEDTTKQKQNEIVKTVQQTIKGNV